MARRRLQLVSTSLSGSLEGTFLSREKSRGGWRWILRRFLLVVSLGGVFFSPSVVGGLVMFLDAIDLGLAAMAVAMLACAFGGWLAMGVAVHLRLGQVLCEAVAFAAGLFVWVAFPGALIGSGVSNPMLEGCSVALDEDSGEAPGAGP